MRRNLELEATIVEKYAAVKAFLDERRRRMWTATESRGYRVWRRCAGVGCDGMVAPDYPQGAWGTGIGRRREMRIHVSHFPPGISKWKTLGIPGAVQMIQDKSVRVKMKN